MGSEFIRVSKAAELLCVTPQTVRKYYHQGKLHGYETPGGQTLYNKQEILSLLQMGEIPDDSPTEERDAHYIRSSNGNKKLMESQAEQLIEKYGEPAYTINDKASGLNEKRKGLQRLIKLAEEGKITRVIVTQKDRLTRHRNSGF